MYDMVFWSLFTGNALVAIYLSINPKMHAQPWRLLLLGFISWLLVFWFQASTEVIVSLVGESNARHLRIGTSLLATAVSAMVGAIFGTAITNRAQLLNKKKLNDLMDQVQSAETLYGKPAEEIFERLTDKSNELSRQEFLLLAERRKDLMFRYRMEMHELQTNIKALNP